MIRMPVVWDDLDRPPRIYRAQHSYDPVADPLLAEDQYCCIGGDDSDSMENKMKPTNPNAHTYDNKPRNHSYERRKRECKVWSVSVERGVKSAKCGVSSVG